MIAYDPLELLDAGIYNRVPNPYGDVVVKSYYVKEKLLTPYIQANIQAAMKERSDVSDDSGDVLASSASTRGRFIDMACSFRCHSVRVGRCQTGAEGPLGTEPSS